MIFAQGYEEVSQKFTSIRRVRGDNYCALRATLFQAMSQPAVLPSWLQDPELTLVRCHRRFESALFLVVSAAKTSLVCPRCVLVLACSATSACRFLQLSVAGMALHSEATKNDCYFPEEKDDKIYLAPQLN